MVPCANTTGHSAVYIGVSASKIIMKALFRKLSHDTSFKFYFELPLISLNLHLAKLHLRFFASSFAKIQTWRSLLLMSTYIDARRPSHHGDYQDCPPLVVRYLYDSETIRGLSPRTVNGYYIDLRTFFRFLKLQRGMVPKNTPLDEIDVHDIELETIESVTSTEIYEFLHYVTRERANSPAARARKLSSLKGFYKYLCTKMKLIRVNPTDDVGIPAQKKRLPKYLSLKEGTELLQSVQSDFYERDYCMITLFLNCGMRLSELVNINVTDIQDDGTIRIIGKGDKERLVYLNEACVKALTRLCDERRKLPNLQDDKALFVSKKTGKRLSARRVQQIVEGCLRAAGLSGKGYSTHKLWAMRMCPPQKSIHIWGPPS